MYDPSRRNPNSRKKMKRREHERYDNWNKRKERNPPFILLAILSNQRLAKAKAKANRDD